MSLHVFAGPTIHRNRILRVSPSATVHPPVRHGDLLRLGLADGDVAVIIDGAFHQVAPVRHKEILELLSRGVTVVGAASMGALRAAELSPFGMQGVGRIYRMYRDGHLEADDEVAVSHWPMEDYRSLSTPLVNVRIAVDAATAAGVISRAQGETFVEGCRALPYPERSWAAISRLASLQGAAATDAFQRLRLWLRAHPALSDAKLTDALEALRHAAGPSFPDGRARVAAWVSTDWRTTYLQQWLLRFEGTTVDGVHVPRLAVLQYQQLYDPGFPARWRRFVLGRIAGAGVDSASMGHPLGLEGGALAVASGRGVTMQHVSPEQRTYWLTPVEQRTVDERELLLRLLVRSCGISPATLDLAGRDPAASRLIEHPSGTERRVARAFVANRAAGDHAAGHDVHHLRMDVLKRHLCASWATGAGSAELLAAARDRGFESTESAAEVARYFCLEAMLPPESVPAPGGLFVEQAGTPARVVGDEAFGPGPGGGLDVALPQKNGQGLEPRREPVGQDLGSVEPHGRRGAVEVEPRRVARHRLIHDLEERGLPGG